MKDFKLEGNRLRPSAFFDSEEGIINLEGRSLLEIAEEVFDPMNKWFEEYVKNPKRQTTINIALEYFNSSTAKAIIRFLVIAKKLEGKSTLIINFYFDDENVLEYGRDFSDVVGLPFNFIEKSFH